VVNGDHTEEITFELTLGDRGVMPCEFLGLRALQTERTTQDKSLRLETGLACSENIKMAQGFEDELECVIR
jgi:hypothetical protein